jgi:large subunit ribosomal protein L6
MVTVKGPKGELSQEINPAITVEIKDGEITVARPDDTGPNRSMHGLYRSLINNMVVGVSQGYTIQQELVGVGFKVEVKGQIVEFSLGFSHEIHIMLPKEVKAEAPAVKKGEAPVLILKSADKQLVGQVAAKVRSLRKPEPYKGKGIKFAGEQIRRKAGKSAASK